MTRFFRNSGPQLAALSIVLLIDWLIFPSFFDLRIVDGRIAEITTFGTELFPAFGLPPTLDRA